MTMTIRAAGTAREGCNVSATRRQNGSAAEDWLHGLRRNQTVRTRHGTVRRNGCTTTGSPVGTASGRPNCILRTSQNHGPSVDVHQEEEEGEHGGEEVQSCARHAAGLDVVAGRRSGP